MVFEIRFIFNNFVFKFNEKPSTIQRKHYKKQSFIQLLKKKIGKTTKTTNFPTLKRKSAILTNKKEKISCRRIPFTELIRRLHKVKGHNHLDDLKRVGDLSHTIYNVLHRVSGHKPLGPTRI